MLKILQTRSLSLYQFSWIELGCNAKNDQNRVKKLFNVDMYLFFEKGLRQRISYSAKRYSKANNKYLGRYDPTKLSKYLWYLDINNLYGWAMSGYRPQGGFNWLKNVDNFDVNPISENSSTGYILDVDLEYP